MNAVARKRSFLSASILRRRIQDSDFNFPSSADGFSKMCRDARKQHPRFSVFLLLLKQCKKIPHGRLPVLLDHDDYENEMMT